MIDFTIIEDFPNCEIEFDQRFSTIEACYDYLAQTKWPNGFVCEKCGHDTYWISTKYIYICKQCERQYSLTAGTIMHATKKPITYWFKAMWWFTTRKSGVNAVNLQQLLGFGSYNTAWAWLQKLRRCTIRKNRDKLKGRVEVDEFFVGGQKPGKRGRGADGKITVFVAVERYQKQNPETLKWFWKIGRARLQVALDCSSDSLQAFVNHNIKTGSTVVTDQWPSYPPILKEDYSHKAAAATIQNRLYGAHLIVTLVKRLIRSTFQARFEPKYLQNYLDEYVFRFNRRKAKSIGKKFMRIVQQVVKSRKIRNEDIQFDLDPISEYFSLGFSG